MSRGAGIIITIIVIVLLILGGWWLFNETEDEVTNNNGTDQDTTDVQETDQQEQRNVFGLAQENTELSTFVSALMEANLNTTLEGEGEYTVFAPNNQAMAEYIDQEETTMQEFLEREDLSEILNYHIVTSEQLSGDLTDGQELETLNGEMLTVSIDTGQVMLVDAAGNEANLVEQDLDATNGVLHIIDAVLVPTAN